MTLLAAEDIVSIVAETKSATGVDQVRLVAEQRGASQAIESIDTGTDVITITGHPFSNDDVIGMDGESLPAGLSQFTDYYIINATADTFQISLTQGGAAVDITASGSGDVFLMLQRDFGTESQSSTYAEGRSYIEGVEIQAGFSVMQFFAENVDDTENASVRRVMVVRGESAAEYSEPIFLYNVQTAENLKYSDTTTVEELKPAEANAERTTNKGTSLLIDDAGLGEAADFANLSSIPSTLSGHSILDGQEDLGPATGKQILQKTGGGDPVWVNQYNEEINAGYMEPLSSDALLSGSFAQYGDVIVIPNPGKEVSVVASSDVYFTCSGTSAFNRLDHYVAISFDGGSTYSSPASAIVRNSQGATSGLPLSGGGSNFIKTGTPTGDIYIAIFARQGAGPDTVSLYANGTSASFIVLPRSDYAITGGALTASIPSTATGSCSKDATSGSNCTASAEISCAANNGNPPYSYSASKVSGSDSITSGASTSTCTVSASHATDDPADTYDTVIKYTVTDDDSTVVDSNNCTVTLSYEKTYADVEVSAPNKQIVCYYNSVTQTECEASGELSRSATGGDGTFTNSWVKLSGNGSITSGASTATPTVSHTGGFDTSGSFEVTVTSNGDSDSDSQTTFFKHTGT